MTEGPMASFPWPIPTTEERHQLLRDALRPLSADDVARLFPVLDVLLVSVLTESELLHRDADNPIEHHTTVLSHMMEIAGGEGFTWDEMRRAAAIAILHDNWPVRKVTREIREGAATNEERAQREDINRQGRQEHMTRGSENARRRLRELNGELGRVEFTDEDIQAICAVIGIHDYPNIDKIIPESDWLAVCFREADRLWMQSPAGVRADLVRKGIVRPTAQQSVEQAAKNLKSYEMERALYSPDAHGFCDDQTLFRTAIGYEIFQRYRRQWTALGDR